ncbi:hypothetical protein BGZ73_002658 [Actinomortierella ambigua]|nr:hypothetical protein BGZ73_002658 [Actinomortierella ambigua]
MLITPGCRYLYLLAAFLVLGLCVACAMASPANAFDVSHGPPVGSTADIVDDIDDIPVYVPPKVHEAPDLPGVLDEMLLGGGFSLLSEFDDHDSKVHKVCGVAIVPGDPRTMKSPSIVRPYFEPPEVHAFRAPETSQSDLLHDVRALPNFATI